ncbi:MAG: hypothetical protein AAF541_01800 [Pseudomonadota bacterium]
MPAPIVFFDIAGPTESNLQAFYQTAFDWNISPSGEFSIGAGASALDGQIRTDPADKVIYLGVPDINTSLDIIQSAGGSVIAPRFEVPGVVVLALFTDPAGNTMGLVEMDGDQPVIPG